MGKTLNLEDGIREINGILKGIIERPILSAVYGIKDHGKSYVIRQLSSQLEAEGLAVSGQASAPDKFDFIGIRDKILPVQFDAYFFHCAWPRFDLNSATFRNQDPNVFAKEILNRALNLNILAYNPNMAPRAIEELIKPELYDFILLNPNSVRKI